MSEGTVSRTDREEPDPRADKSIVARWKGGLGFDSDTEFGGSAVMEGQDGRRGARPSELLLVALVGCTAMDVISILLKKRQRPVRYAVRSWGQQRTTHPKTFTEIVVEHEMEGDDVDVEAMRRAIELSATKYCPVTAHIAQGDTRISHRYRLRNRDGEQRAEVVMTGPRGEGLQPQS